MTQGQTLIGTSVTDIGGGVVTDLKTLDVLSDGLDDTDSFVTGNKGELGHEFSLVDVLVGSTDTTEDDWRVRVNERETNRARERQISWTESYRNHAKGDRIDRDSRHSPFKRISSSVILGTGTRRISNFSG
jgi:hypothetical protein